MSERRCSHEGCNTILSRYNMDSRCSVHRGEGSDIHMHAERLHGQKLAEWLREYGNCSKLPDSAVRRLNDWGNGLNNATVWAADSVVTACGRSLHEIPDEIWLSPEEGEWRKSPRVKPEDKLKAIERVKRGEQVTTVARSLGVSARAVNNWLRGVNLGISRKREAVAA